MIHPARTCSITGLALALVTVLTTVMSPACAAAGLTADLQAVVDEFLAANPTAPGVVVYVQCPSCDLAWTGTAGTLDRGNDEPLPGDCTFRIASNTKTYVATAMLRLAEQGRVNLDDPLSRHLPPTWRDWLVGDGYDVEAMTLRQVLSHTSGLAEHSGDPRYGETVVADPQHHWTRDEQIRLCVQWCDPIGAPGEKYSYSDTGYIILGGIIERITGEPLGVAVRKLCRYQDLGMTVTWWEYQEPEPTQAGPRAHQYFGDLDTRDWHASFDLYGGGGLITDARELGLFMRALLTGRVFDQQATLQAMTGGGTAPYRLGLMVMELGGHLAFGHQGFWNTFSFHVPTLDLTVAGSVMNHHATNGKELAAALIATVAEHVAR